MKELTDAKEREIELRAWSKNEEAYEALKEASEACDKAFDAHMSAILDGADEEVLKTLHEEFLHTTAKIDNLIADNDMYYTAEEAVTRKNSMTYEAEHEDVIQSLSDATFSYGANSEEAEAARDLYELVESVQTYDAEYRRASNDLEEMKNEIDRVDKAIDEFNQEVSGGNPYAEFIGEMEADEEALKARAEAIAAAAKLKHPFKYVAGTLKDSIKELETSKKIAKNAGIDYENSLEKACKAVVAQGTGLYNFTKTGIVSTLQGIAEKAASLYKGAVEKFTNMVDNAKDKFFAFVKDVDFKLDCLKNTITLGYYAQHRIHDEMMAIGEYDGVNMSPDMRVSRYIENHEHGAFFEAYKNLSDKSYNKVTEYEFGQKVDGTMRGTPIVKATHRREQGKDLDYWISLNKACYGDKMSFAQKDKAMTDKVMQSVMKADAAVTKMAGKVKEKAEHAITSAKEMLSDAKDAVVAKGEQAVDYAKAVPGKIADGVNQLAHRVKAFLIDTQVRNCEMVADVLGKAAAHVEKSERRIDNQINKIKDFDNSLDEKISKLQSDIAELRSPQATVARPAYQPSKEALSTIELLNAAKAVCADSRAIDFALNCEIAKIAKEERKFDQKERVTSFIKNIGEEFDKAGLRFEKTTEINNASMDKMAAQASLGVLTAKVEASKKMKEMFQRGQGFMIGKAQDIKEQSEKKEPEALESKEASKETYEVDTIYADDITARLEEEGVAFDKQELGGKTVFSVDSADAEKAEAIKNEITGNGRV